MSKWDEFRSEPMHDHPAEKDQLVAAMEAAGYILDTMESTEDNLRFFGDYGNILTTVTRTQKNEQDHPGGTRC